MAGVVTAHRFRQRNRRARSVALQDIADALIDRGLQRVDRILHRPLVVEGHDLEAHPRGVAAVDPVGHELPALQLILADCGEGAGERVDESELDGRNLPRMHWRSAQQHASSQGGKKISAGGVHGLQSLLFCAARHNKSREEQRGNAISTQIVH